jgi:hypothetical protein
MGKIAFYQLNIVDLKGIECLCRDTGDSCRTFKGI